MSQSSWLQDETRQHALIFPPV